MSGTPTRRTPLSAAEARARAESTGFFLWVNQQNPEAQAFYRAHGAREVGRRPSSPPGGVPGRLNGAPVALRYAWSDAATRF